VLTAVVARCSLLLDGRKNQMRT